MNWQDIPILVVDDHQEMTRLVGRLLRSIGFRRIDQATDGPAAIDLLRKTRYRLLLVDWHMRPTSGRELIQAIKTNPGLGSPSIVVMSGSNTRETIMAVQQLNVTGYLLKPFSSGALKQKLAVVLGMDLSGKQPNLSPAHSAVSG